MKEKLTDLIGKIVIIAGVVVVVAQTIETTGASVLKFIEEGKKPVVDDSGDFPTVEDDSNG